MLRQWLRRFRRPSDEDFAAEVEAHLAHETDEQIERGLPPEDARYAALRRFGNVTRHLERFREASPWFWLETVWQDVRYAVRGFRRAPWFSITAVASMALGIGFNSALFSAFDAVLFRPLPYPEANRIVTIGQGGYDGTNNWGVWPAVFEEWQSRSTVFEHMGVADTNRTLAVLRDGAITERAEVLRMSSGYLAAFGVEPAVGRAILPDDDKPGSTVAVVTHDWWQRHAQGRASALGTSVWIDGTGYTIVGVMPPGFRLYHESYLRGQTWTDVYLSDPWAFNPRTNRWCWLLSAVGRLKPGVSIERADAEMKALARSTDYGAPPSPGWGHPRFEASVSPLDLVRHETLTRLWLTWGIVFVIMMLASANTANLLLARAGARRLEVGIRAAIGASRGRLVRQFLTESVVLSFAGGMAGLAVAVFSRGIVSVVMPDPGALVRLPEAGLNWRVFAFTLAASIATGIAFGLAPAFRGSRRIAAAAAGVSRRATADRDTIVTRHLLLVMQLALSLVLLSGAGLMVTTLAHLRAKPLGFDPEGLITFAVETPRGAPYLTDLGLRPDATKVSTAQVRYWAATPLLQSLPERLTARLSRVPGVVDATVATGIPMIRSLGFAFSLVDLPTPSADEAAQRNATWVKATPGYFRTLGMRVDAGRTMSEADRRGSRPVVVINHQMAQKYWRRELDALGSHILVETETTPREVIGIVNDVRFWVHHEPLPALYAPIAQTAAEPYDDFVVPIALHQNVAVRVSRESASTIEAIRRAVAEATDGLPLEHVRSMREAIYDASDNTPAYTILLTSGAVLAVLLAAIGIVGMVSYSVSQRMHEIAIRVTLGASRRAILTLLLSTGARLACAGVVLGLLASLWATRLLRSELDEVSPTDPRILLMAGLLLFAVVLVATWLPARRATHADPLVTLRTE